MKIEDVIKWCDKKTTEGSKIAICWEGGGDSGWVYMEVDGAQSTDPEAEWLVDRMYSVLDYGSWAGEFNASGRAEYDIKTKIFEESFDIRETYKKQLEYFISFIQQNKQPMNSFADGIVVLKIALHE